MNYPTYIEYEGEYEINTDFRVALKCLELINDKSIEDMERSIAVVTMLFGEDIPVNDETLSLAVKFLQCGDVQEQNHIVVKDMDFQQDEALIEASFMSDYQIDISDKEMHWWKFCNLVSGLKPDSVLNRVREIRNYDLSLIKDEKQRRKIIDAQKQVALKVELSEEDKKELDDFEKLFE
ncbi:bacteriophage Gp15 family protein [Breznakia sp. OttesenSCG-928-G09]|nr:bacteriophage Gp15 family protein [Breznakia sp. OttesenSCG-928-G09]